MPNKNGTAANLTDAVAVYRFALELQRKQLIGKIGIIYNGAANDTSDEGWMNSARDHMRLMEGKYGLHPEQVIIQSWTPNPTHAMPDSSPGALTSLVNFYLSARK